MPIKFRAGTFTTPTSTGSATFDTGLGELPSGLWIACSGSADGTINSGVRICHGASDGTNQWSIGVAVEDPSPGESDPGPGPFSDKIDSQTKLVRLCNDAATIILEGAVTAFHSDGTVTVNWTTVLTPGVEVGFAAWSGCSTEVGTVFVASTDASPITVATTFQPRAVLMCQNAGTEFNFGGGWNAEAFIDQAGVQFGGRWDAISGYFWEDEGGYPIIVKGVGGPFAATTLYKADPANFAPTSFKLQRDLNDQPHASRAFGWIAIGEGPVRFDIDSLDGWDGTNHWDRSVVGSVPRGAILFRAVYHPEDTDPPFTGADRELRCFSFGAFDEQNNQWNAVAYGDQSLINPYGGLKKRAFYAGEAISEVVYPGTKVGAITVAMVANTSDNGTLTTATSGTVYPATGVGLMFMDESPAQIEFVPQIYRYVIV